MTSASPSNVDRQPFVGPLPQGEAYSPLLAPPASVAMRSGLVTLDPGAECGEHSTESHEEMIVCLAGEGEIDARRADHASGSRPNGIQPAEHAAQRPQHRRSRHALLVHRSPGTPRSVGQVDDRPSPFRSNADGRGTSLIGPTRLSSAS